MTGPIFKASGIPLFKSAGIPAMDPNCCCPDCTLCTQIPPLDYCTQCAAGDFPTSYTVPGDWQVDTSGVTAGNNNLCFLCGVASHNSFFNRSVILSPCSPLFEARECIWLCKTTDTFGGQDNHILELNYIGISAGQSAWQGMVTMCSYIAQVNTAIGAMPNCSLIAIPSNGGPLASPVNYEVCRSYFTQSFSRTPPTYQQYKYYPDTCPAGCDNPIGPASGGCYPSGWALTAGTKTANWRTGNATNTSCRAANDVTGAAVSIYAV